MRRRICKCGSGKKWLVGSWSTRHLSNGVPVKSDPEKPTPCLGIMKGVWGQGGEHSGARRSFCRTLCYEYKLTEKTKSSVIPNHTSFT